MSLACDVVVVVTNDCRLLVLNLTAGKMEEAQHGRIRVDNNTLLDATTKRSYYSLFKGKALLSRPRVMDDADLLRGPRVLDQVCGH